MNNADSRLKELEFEQKSAPMRRRLVIVFASIMLILLVVGFVAPRFFQGTGTADDQQDVIASEILKSVRTQTAPILMAEFRGSRPIEITEEIRSALSDLPSGKKLKKAEVPWIAAYTVDPLATDWDVRVQDSKLLVHAPVPDLEDVKIDYSKADVVLTDGTHLNNPDEKSRILDFFQDDLPTVLEDEELERSSQRQAEWQAGLSKFFQGVLHDHHWDNLTVSIVFGVPTDETDSNQ